MKRILLIPVGEAKLPGWQLPHFQVDRAQDEEDGLRRLAVDPLEAAVLVTFDLGGQVEAWLAAAEAACGPNELPMLLAAPAHRAMDHLASLAVDAFLDPSWPEALVEGCLGLAISRVRSGRGLAEIQHKVLRAVRDEVAALKALSIRDELTGLFNYRYFQEVVGKEHERCRRHHRPYALVYFDLDNLRQLNNTFGHDLGNAALRRFGLTLSTTTRHTDFAFRVGGDEFVSLLIEASPSVARLYAERIRTTLEHCALVAGAERITVSTSIGIAVYPDAGASMDAVLNAADAALFQAKARQRNCVVVSGEPPTPERSSG